MTFIICLLDSYSDVIFFFRAAIVFVRESRPSAQWSFSNKYPGVAADKPLNHATLKTCAKQRAGEWEMNLEASVLEVTLEGIRSDSHQFGWEVGRQLQGECRGGSSLIQQQESKLEGPGLG